MKSKKYHYLINILWSEEDQLYIAEVPELEGCISHGKTAIIAIKNAENAIASWILAAKKMKHLVPEPALKRNVSGKFNLRLPKEIHKSLIVRALKEGVSLNHMVATLLARAV